MHAGAGRDEGESDADFLGEKVSHNGQGRDESFITYNHDTPCS